MRSPAWPHRPRWPPGTPASPFWHYGLFDLFVGTIATMPIAGVRAFPARAALGFVLALWPLAARGHAVHSGTTGATMGA